MNVPSEQYFVGTQKSHNSIDPTIPIIGKINSKYKTVSFNPRITIYPFNPSENIHSPKRSLHDSLGNSDEKTTTDCKLLDNFHTPLDADVSPPLSFKISQRIPREPIVQLPNPLLANIIPPTSPLDATSSQNQANSQKKFPELDEVLPPTSQIDATPSQKPTFSQSRLTRRLHRQTLKDYRTNIPLSKKYFVPKSGKYDSKRAQTKFNDINGNKRH